MTKWAGRGEERGGEKQTIGERKEWDFRERNSTLSLEFPAIRPSDPGKPKDKVAPHGKGNAWVLVFLEFQQLQEVGVFSYLIYFRFKSFVNGLVDMRP